VSPPDRIAAALLERLPPSIAAAAVHRHGTTLVGVAPSPHLIAASGSDALATLDDLAPGFWAGFVAFELGHAVERIAGTGAAREPASVPDVVLARFDALAVIAPDGQIVIEGRGPGRRILEHAREMAARGPCRATMAARDWTSSLTPDEFTARVEAVLELLRAGECYQVNLTRRLVHHDALDAVALFGTLADRHPAPHLAFWRCGLGGELLTVVSASPERFLRVAGDEIETRPIKGTAATASELETSAKNRAENVMIVDLARNDLGRVCLPGSITVPALCDVEAHPGLHHLVSTVRGRLQPRVGFGALLAATFPPASVTGAPKPRVLQAIDDLEPVRRGVYCGAVGWIDTRRPGQPAADLAVAIRTFAVSGEPGNGWTHFGVGAGIVADSDPATEWAETELKAARLLDLTGARAVDARARAASLVRA
jgi:para-aminobenzoate synthetase component 1